MFIRITSTLMLMLILLGCSSHKPLTLKKTVHGYTFEIKAVPSGAVSGSSMGLLKKAAAVFKDRLDLFSSEENAIEKLNAERGPMKVSPELYGFLLRVSDLNEMVGDEWNPYLGDVRKLWGVDSSTPSHPHPDSLYNAVMAASGTRIVLSGDNQVALEGDGSLYLGRAVLGWAIDEAAQLLIDSGVRAAVISAGGAYRQWGKPSADDLWAVKINQIPDDNTQFRIESDDGGLCSIYLSDYQNENNIISEIIYPYDGQAREGMLNLTIWAPDALQACVFAEVMYSMQRQQMLRWSEGFKSVGIFFVQSGDIGLFAESNPRMSPWVSSYLP